MILQLLLPAAVIGTLTSVTAVVAQALSGNTGITLGEAATVAVFVGGLVVWLARKLQKIEDDIEGLKKEISSRPCQKDGKNCPL